MASETTSLAIRLMEEEQRRLPYEISNLEKLIAQKKIRLEYVNVELPKFYDTLGKELFDEQRQSEKDSMRTLLIQQGRKIRSLERKLRKM